MLSCICPKVRLSLHA